MARAITRTVSTTKINVSEFVDGSLKEKESVYVPGSITDAKRLMSEVRKAHGKAANVVITGTEIIEEKRAISFDDFMKYSVPVNAEEDTENED